MRLRALGVALSVAPAAVFLGLFFSLAAHMQHTLGAWPNSIGMRGFPPALVTHANLTTWWFISLIYSVILLLLPAAMVCVAVRRLAPALPYLGLYAFCMFLAFVVMLLAPSPFLTWWLD